MASYGKISLGRLTLVVGALLAVIGGQFMSGLALHGTSAESGTGVSAANGLLVQTGQDRPNDDRWD